MPLATDNMVQLRYQDFAYVVMYTKDNEVHYTKTFHHDTERYLALAEAEEIATELELDILNSNVRVCRTRNRMRDGEILSPGR